MTLDFIRTLIMRAKTEGVPESTAALNGLAAAHEGVAKSAVASATATDTSAKSQLSLQQTLQRNERRFNTALRNQQDFEKLQRLTNIAVEQNPALQERANAMLAQAAIHYGQAGVGAKAFAAATSGVSGQLIALSAGAGPVGVFLAALGPWGIAAAVGIGGIEKALSAATDAAHAFAQKAEELRKFSEVTGLTTNQVQALRSEASKFGVTSEEAQTAIQNFTSRFNELRLGTGEMLTQIRRVNPALADQMAGMTNASDALTLFGRALQNVDNIFQRNALVRAATGRGGLSAARFLSGLDADQVTASYVAAGKALDHDLIEKVAQLEIDIRKSSDAISKNIASIFSESVLQSERDFLKYFEDISKIARDFSVSAALEKMVSDDGWLVKAAKILPLVGPLLSVYQRFANPGGASQAQSNSQPFVPPPLSLSGIASAVGLQNLHTPEFDAGKLRELVSILGPAATLTEQYKSKLADLQIKAKSAGISQGDLNRAISGLNLQTVIEAESRRLSLLGPLASIQDAVAQKEREVALARMQGVNITKAQTDAIVNLARVQAESTRISAQAQIGVFDLTAAQQAAGHELQSWIDRKLLDPKNPEQMAAAMQGLSDKYRQVAETAALAATPFKGLKQLELDAGNLGKMLDQTGVSALNSLSTSMVDFTTGTKSAKDAVADFSKAFLRAVDEMVIKILILGPLANALKGALGGIGMPLSLTPSINPGNGGGTGGILPASQAPFFSNDNRPVSSPRSASPTNGGRGVVNNFTVITDQPVQKTESKNETGGVDITAFIGSTVAKHMLTPGSPVDRAMNARKTTLAR